MTDQPSTRLRISYKAFSGEVTERIIAAPVFDPPDTIVAFCELRGAERSFRLDRIVSAVDLATGEVIEDLAAQYGVSVYRKPKPQRPKFTEAATPMSTQAASAQRKKDKYALFKPFRTTAFIELAKRKLYALFDDRCFRCGSDGRLQLDHHIPQHLGGRLVPGNVVLLCARCNSLKGRMHPDEFYPNAVAINSLQPILDAQLTLFDFEFDYATWFRDPRSYLVAMGASERFADEVINDPQSPYYMRSTPLGQGEDEGMSFTVDWEPRSGDDVD